MKHISIALFFMLLANMAAGQKKEKPTVLSKKKLLVLDCYYYQTGNGSKNITLEYKYYKDPINKLTAIETIVLDVTQNNAQVNTFIQNLHAAQNLLGTKAAKEWKEPEYSLATVTMGDYVVLWKHSSVHSTAMTKVTITRVLEWLGENGFK